ncbi:heparin lyase I family protein [Arthrobacter halodurans]|uniref:Heparin lyase I family protein n=1 Tax=Arthrobacter halodurans TaxID=516699 RepID=A0ABV4UMK7_9MICC
MKIRIRASLRVIGGILTAAMMVTTLVGEKPITYKSAPAVAIVGGDAYVLQTPGNGHNAKVATNRKSIHKFQLRAKDLNRTEPSSQRVEYAGAAKMPFSKDVWVAFSLKVDKAPTPPWVLVGQFHQTEDKGEPGTSPVFAQELNNGRFQIVTRGDAGKITRSTTIKQRIHYINPAFPRGQWVNFVYRLRFERNGSGRIQAWIGGKQVVNATGPLGCNDRIGPYWKFGIYRAKNPGRKAITVHYANVEVGTASLRSRIAKPKPIQ